MATVDPTVDAAARLLMDMSPTPASAPPTAPPAALPDAAALLLMGMSPAPASTPPSAPPTALPDAAALLLVCVFFEHHYFHWVCIELDYIKRCTTCYRVC